MVNGYPINWAMPRGSKLTRHPLYIKYSKYTLGEVTPNEVQLDLAAILAIADNAEICAYLSWLLRSTTLINAP